MGLSHWSRWTAYPPGFFLSKIGRILNRVSFFIDGFNLYHALMAKEHLKPFRWINFRRLAECFLRPNDTLADIFYFTALAHWDNGKVKRHLNFIRIQEYFRIKVIRGEFRKTTKNCRVCHKSFVTFEEKETDVNIAIQLFEQAYLNSYDTAIILSGDSDQLPAIRAVKKIFPLKKFGIIIPPEKTAENLKKEADFYRKIKISHLRFALLDDPIVLPDGTKIFCPENWKQSTIIV